ncbi:MAG: ribosome small subunit-dependent GTPase A [Planctomycetia bacterium]|nr:ribosome small subunit-dependent GTPase A [Planctomycetia bacterium]
MSAKKNKKETTSKIRVDFRKNRNERTRITNWTQKFQQNELQNDKEDLSNSERISGKGNLVRKRTIIGTALNRENASGERGDFDILPKIDANDCFEGRVIRVHGLYSYVEDSKGRLFTCATRRILKTISTDQRQIVVAGDRVLFRDAQLPERLEGIIERVEPRFGTLSRTSRNRKHIIVTNIDQAFIVASAAEPRLKPNLIDRFLVTCDRAGIKPIICINKIDLIDLASLQPLIGVYSQMGYSVIPTSVITGVGVERLKRLMNGCQSVVVGQSGVGKSSLLNQIDPSLDLKIGKISAENQKGKHTTTTAELLKLTSGGYVVDTPGIRQFMLWDFIPEEVIGFYRDLRPYENLCRFPDCSHTHEDFCAVKDAIADGRLDLRRYESYLALRAGEMLEG